MSLAFSLGRFRVFSTVINLKPHNIESIVRACCTVHNFLINKVPSLYAPPECFDNENTTEEEYLKDIELIMITYMTLVEAI